MFNAATKTGRWSFTIPLRKLFVIDFLEFLLKEGLIESYSYVGEAPKPSYGAAMLLGPVSSNFCHLVRINLREQALVRGIKSVSKPGKFRYMDYRELSSFVEKRGGGAGVVVVSSPYFARLCNAREALAVRTGGLVVCTIEA